MERFLRVLFVLLSAALSVTACSTDRDCSLNGVCSNNNCACDPGWIGGDCGVLDVRNAKPANGYDLTASGTSSWCASIAQDPNNKKLFHLFSSEFIHKCGLDSWATTSRVIRATSSTGPQGPYYYAAEVAGTFAHNPTVVYSPADRQYLLYRIGCTNPVNAGSCRAKAGCVAGTGTGESTTHVHTSSDLINWSDHGVIMSGSSSGWDKVTTNPSAFPLYTQSNPTSQIIFAYRGANWGQGGVSSEHLGITSGPNYLGPYPHTSPLFPTSQVDEDPFLWRDKRGNWHMLIHGLFASAVGRHAFATTWNGPWTLGGTTAYGTQVKFTDGKTINYARRERPQLYFSTDGNMTPLYLANGVQESEPQSYSLIVPIGDGAAAYEKSLGFSGGDSGGGGGGTPTTTTKAATTKAATTTSKAGGGSGSPLYGQCGGMGWTGPTTCAQGTCKYSNDYYSQCL